MGVPVEKLTAIESLVAAMGEISDPPKTKEVRAGAKKYNYAPLEEFLPGIRNVLLRHGFVLTFSVFESVMYARLMHVSGETIESEFPMVGADRDPQAAGSAATYARRYALLNLLGLVADGDDDGETASKPQAAKAPAKSAEQIGAERKTETPDQKKERKESHDPSWEANSGKFFGRLKNEVGIGYNELLAFLYWCKEEGKTQSSGKKPSEMDEGGRSLLLKFLKGEKGKTLYAEWKAAHAASEANYVAGLDSELDPGIPF